LYPPAPPPETLIAPAIVRLPVCEVVPITKVPAVMAERSAATILNVPPAPPTEIDLAPLGISETVPAPAPSVPESVTSLAVMVTAELVVEIDVLPALVTFPVPSVVIVTPVVPVALAFKAIVPFDPAEVVSANALPEKALEAVMLPLAVMVNVPLLDVIAPVVVKLAEAPVVATEKLPPTVEAPRATAPALETSAVALPPELIVKPVEAAVKIGVPGAPILPVPEVSETVGAVTVTAPVRVIVPEPLAFKLITPLAPVETLALIAMAELFPLVDRLTVAAPDVESAAPTVNVPLELTVIGLVVPEIAPGWWLTLRRLL